MRPVMLFGLVLGALSTAGEVILCKPGQIARFKCEANPQYRTLEWKHGGKRVVNINGQNGMKRFGSEEIAKRSKPNDLNLEVSNVKKEDAGKFICVVDGKTQEHTLLVVSVSVSPSPVLLVGSTATLQCEVQGSTSVKWKRPDSGQTGSGIVQLNPVKKSDNGKWECLFTHDTRTYNESLNIVVKEPAPKPAAIPTKKSPEVPASPCNNCDTTPSPQLELSWWIWVAIGVGSLVVFLLLVLVIVLCKRIRRKKRKHHRRQNGHQPMKPRQYCKCNRPTAAAAKPQHGRRGMKPVALPQQPLLME